MNPAPENPPVLVLVGPTAIGKTSFSIELAQTFNCEIISVDSMQVYKYMDIGTAKVSREEMKGIAHYLIDIVTPDAPYDAARFSTDATAAISAIHARGKIPLLTGGTGLYLKTLLYGIFREPAKDEEIRAQLKIRLKQEGAASLHSELRTCDPESAERIHINDTHRVLRGLEIYLATGRPWSSFLKDDRHRKKKKKWTNILQIGLQMERKALYNRIDLRTKKMLDADFKGEVESLLEKGYSRNLKSMGSIGYRHMTAYLSGETTFQEMQESLAADTRRYAKRQMTWFKKMEDLNWIDIKKKNRAIETVSSWLERF
ncbi:tRNA (adenosine(37)-N6)-dimethylallyltransferase MiaA [Desulfomarina sp.]